MAGLEFSVLLDRPALALASSLHFNCTPSLILHVIDLLTFFAVILLWVLPPVFAVGFALRARWASCLHWGFSISLLLLAAFAWYRNNLDEPIPLRWAVVATLILLVSERLASARKLLSNKKLIATQIAALFILFAPYLSALLFAQKLPPIPRKLWSVVLQNGTWQAMNTGSEFEATRHTVFAGDRIVAVFDAERPFYDGKRPMSKYCISSLDTATGAVKNQTEFMARWGATPLLFATNTDHVILENGSLQQLKPDLSPTGKTFTPDHGRVINISPDGTTLAAETYSGTTSSTTLLDANSFVFLVSLSDSVPTSISRQAMLSDNHFWLKDYPNEYAFITKTDPQGSKLIFHSVCGLRPQFLTQDRILSISCGSIRILDAQGKIISETRNPGLGTTFAGVNRMGTRFALQASDQRGDPPMLLYERFFIYDTNTAKPIATISVDDLPERQSWTAFSPDGHLFAVGNPNKLSLYELP